MKRDHPCYILHSQFDRCSSVQPLFDDLESVPRIETAMCSIDDLVAQGFPAPNVVKLDVEGGEGLVLDGMQRTRPEHIFCEIHSQDFLAKYDTTPHEVAQRFYDYGYKPKTIWLRNTELLCHFQYEGSAH